MKGVADAVVGFDADGVLIDSQHVAFKAAEDIAALFGQATKVTSRVAYNEVFGSSAQVRLVGEDNTATLRAMHRLVMRARAEHVTLFEECFPIVRRMRRPPLVITAAFASGVRRALAGHAKLFVDIRGREYGSKEALLAAASQAMKLYVTDTVRDIERCRACGIPVAAVTWGYDAAEDLGRANPDVLVRNPLELATVLSDRSLLNTDGGSNES